MIFYILKQAKRQLIIHTINGHEIIKNEYEEIRETIK